MADETTPGSPSGEPTDPRGARPAGPPAGPPPSQAPTALPPRWNQGGQPPPPYQPGGPGGPGGGWGGPPQGPGGPPPGAPGGYGGPPPQRKRRTGLIVASLLALTLVIGLGVAGWFYFTGRFGIGPLSAADKEAASAITDGVEKPAWAEGNDVECAVDDLVSEHRSKGLEKRGVVEKDGDSWSYTGEWRGDDATTFYESLLDCDEDWADKVGEEWKLSDADCLGDIDPSTIGAFFAQDSLTLASDEESVEEDSKKAVEELDECYLEEPAAPDSNATPAYRAVEFSFAEPEKPEAGELVVSTGGEGNWTPISGTSVEVETDEGGAKGCLEVQAATTYPWGSTAASETEICGKAKPKRIWWQKPKNRCTTQPGCYSFQLNYEGFKDFASITARYTSNGGSCDAVSGSCSDTVIAVPGGRGTVVTWSFPGSYRGTFVAKVGAMKAKIPN